MGVVIGIWWFCVHLTAGQKHIGPVDSKLADYWLHSCPAVPSYPTVGRFILLVRISNRWIILGSFFMRKHKSLDCTTDRWTVSIIWSSENRGPMGSKLADYRAHRSTGCTPGIYLLYPTVCRLIFFGYRLQPLDYHRKRSHGIVIRTAGMS